MSVRIEIRDLSVPWPATTPYAAILGFGRKDLMETDERDTPKAETGHAPGGRELEEGLRLLPRDFLKVEPPIRHRVVIAFVLVTAILVAVLASASSSGILSGSHFVSGNQATTSALTTHGFLEMSVEAEGWTEESTPAIARLRAIGSDEYLLCHAVDADSRETVELEEGSYYLSWITPCDSDGSLYIPPVEQIVRIRAGHTTSYTGVFMRVPVAESTFEDYAATIDIAYEAVTHGDETLSGVVGEAFMRKLQSNANAAPNFYIYIPNNGEQAGY